jgi:rhodanese-related sulfurtransferase
MTSLKRITPKEASELLAQGYTYVDVRTVGEFEAGHPAGAVNVPISDADFGRVMRAAFAKDAKIIVGCKAGVRSLRAAQALLADGFTDVLDQRAGWDAERNAFGQMAEPGWSRVGLPSETGSPSGRSWEDMKKKAVP